MNLENIKSYDDSLLEAKEVKYPQIWTEYHSIVDDVAQTGVSGRHTQKQKKLQEKSNKRLTKKSNGQSLTTQEQADEDWFDKYNDWTDDNHDVADSACDAVELMTNIDEVNAFDPVNDPVWIFFIP